MIDLTTKFTYENQGSNTYLVYEIGAGEELDTMSLGMLTNNSIHGFAATSFTQMDTTRYIKYNVSAKVSVSQLFSGVVNRKRLLGVFSGIVNAMLEAEEYMLEPGSILLDLDHIFADVSTCETVVICLPLMEVPFKNEDLGKLIKNIMFTTQFDHTENCDHVTQILNFLNSSPVFSLMEFKALLDQLNRGGAPVQAPRPAYQPAPQPVAAPVQPMQPPVQPMQPPVQPMQPPVQPMQPPVQPMQPPVQQPAPKAPQPAPKAPQPAPKAPQPAQPPMGFAVPGKNTPQQPPMQVPKPAAAAPRMGQQPTAEDEEPISLMYLMQHYNKENAAKYKAQQEAKKNKGKEPAPAPMPPQGAPGGFAVPGKGAPAPMPPQGAPGGFAVPGKGAPAPMPPQGAPGGFAVPGKGAPAPMPPQGAPGGFAVPGKSAPAPMQPPVQPMPQQPAAPAYQQPVAPVYQQPVAPAYQQPAQPGRPLNFGETTVLGGGAMGETTVLGGGMPEQAKPEPYLIRSKNNEKIPLNKPVFRIGKEKSYVDYFIGDNTAISRSHANIVNHNGEYFVVDTNSTNHTYVNGGMINSNEEIKLSHGTKIRLANEDFEFKLY